MASMLTEKESEFIQKVINREIEPVKYSRKILSADWYAKGVIDSDEWFSCEIQEYYMMDDTCFKVRFNVEIKDGEETIKNVELMES